MKLLAVFLACTLASFAAAERETARSMVIHTKGIAATAQTLASQAAVKILDQGGSAMDAAIAANAVLGLVEPMMNGIGGDLFFLYREAKTGKIQGMNAAGPAPAGLSVEYLQGKGMTSLPAKGIHVVTVPGAVKGWEEAHKRYGKLPWGALFTAAIDLARNGFAVTEIIGRDWQDTVGSLEADENAKKVFLPGGQAPQVGEVFKNPGLAEAYALIAKHGAKAFYEGEIAKALLATSQRLGGTMTAKDLTSFKPVWQEPIATEYRGWKVMQMPPPGQGVGVLEMLNLLENFDLKKMGALSADAFHTKIEAQKLMFADIRSYVADPKFAKVPTAGLLDKGYAKARAAKIRMDKANCEAIPGDPAQLAHNTTYFTIVDKEGNLVSWIQSISDVWGSRVVVDQFGFHLHDRGGAFRWDAGHPNQLKPGKTPYHTIIPGMMEKDGVAVAFGIMGGLNQVQAHVQFVSNYVDHGMNVQEALEAPRFTKTTLGGCRLPIESRVPEAVRKELEGRGHDLDVRPAFSTQMGGGQAIAIDTKKGLRFGGSSPRKDGAAIPQL